MGTHMIVLSESFTLNTNITGFWMVFKNLCIPCLLDKSSLSIGRVYHGILTAVLIMFWFLDRIEKIHHFKSKWLDTLLDTFSSVAGSSFSKPLWSTCKANSHLIFYTFFIFKNYQYQTLLFVKSSHSSVWSALSLYCSRHPILSSAWSNDTKPPTQSKQQSWIQHLWNLSVERICESLCCSFEGQVCAP